MPSYSLWPFSTSQLASLLDKYSHRGEGRSQGNSHLSYFDEYFAHVGAKTIIVEAPYTDKDYLEDYSAYYARCHETYERQCARFHFFDVSLDQAHIQGCLDGLPGHQEKLQSSYLGFIVVKPLPSRIIGRTCLRTYGTVGRQRIYPVTQTCRAHFLGMDLTVESVPFQEQDTDVAACATSALWSALHCTGKLFQHHIPTPAEITKAAAVHIRPFGRSLPAISGLSYDQMADALRSVGLEPLLLKASDLDAFRTYAYAYLQAGIPSVVVGELGQGAPFVSFGRHAMTVAGFSQPPQPTTSALNTQFSATRIERLYAHDDQVGPFARLSFQAGNHLVGTSWLDHKTRTRGGVLFRPELMIVPLYHKIRVPVDAIIKAINSLDIYIETARGGGLLPLPQRVDWEVRLEANSTFKSRLLGLRQIKPGFRERLLEEDLPRFIWRAVAHGNTGQLFELVFDTTDLMQGAHFCSGLPYDASICKTIGLFLSNPAVQGHMQSTGPRSALKAAAWFSDNQAKF
jgi:hypothetical protein